MKVKADQQCVNIYSSFANKRAKAIFFGLNRSRWGRSDLYIWQPYAKKNNLCLLYFPSVKNSWKEALHCAPFSFESFVKVDLCLAKWGAALNYELLLRSIYRQKWKIFGSAHDSIASNSGPDIGGPHAPYRQSERTEIYNKLVEELVQKDMAFPCFCSDEEIDESRQEAERKGLPPIYRGRWANATSEVVTMSQGQLMASLLLKWSVNSKSVN